MKKYFIKDLFSGQTLKDEVFLLKTLNKKTTKNGQEYWDLNLIDKTGNINAKVWNNAIAYCDFVDNNTIVKIDASVEEGLNGNGLQLFIKRMKKTDDFDKSDFIKTSELDYNFLLEKIKKYIGTINDKYIKKLLNNLFEQQDFIDKYIDTPAAEKNHHDFIAGLMQHSCEMLDLANAIFPYYPELNKDLVIAGIILHDIGKIEELNIKNNIERTESGALLGHIYQGSYMIQKEIEKIENFPKTLKNQIIHIILSHHGQLEWGSPVKPLTMEAHLVFLTDKLSSQLQIVRKIIKNELNLNKDWSSYQNILSSRLLLKYIDDNTNKVNTSTEDTNDNNNENSKDLSKNNLELPF